MSDTERFLREYWFARRSIGRLMLDLSAAKAAAEQFRKRQSETGEGTDAPAARILLGQHCAEAAEIERRLNEERSTIARIEAALKQAELTEREREYVRLRYFENRSAEAVCQRMYCSPATGGRIREAVLGKFTAHTG